MLVTRLAHIALGSEDPERLGRFYGDLFGLVEVADHGGIRYLASGRTPGYELAIGPWAPGVDHFALGVPDRKRLSEVADRLTGAGATVEDLDVTEDHALAAGIRFVLPSGHITELVVQAEPEVFRAVTMIDHRHFAGAGPVPLEHITMSCGDVEQTATFLIDQLGLRLTESVQPMGRPWFNAFLRCRDRHHDVAFFALDDDAPGLNHFCFAVPSVEYLVRVADLAAGHGITLDASPGRHINGNNIFIYFKDPDGNRLEVNTDMAEIDPAAPARILDEMRFDAWRESIPPQVLTSSACRDGRVAHVESSPR